MKYNPYQTPDSFFEGQSMKKHPTAKALIEQLRTHTNQQLSWQIKGNTITATLLPPGNGWSETKEVFVLSGGFGEKGEISDFIDIGATGRFNKVQSNEVGILGKNYAAKLLLKLIPAEESLPDGKK